jgi:hypothetical protein
MRGPGISLVFNAETARRSTLLWTALSCLEKKLTNFWRLSRPEVILLKTTRKAVNELAEEESTEDAHFSKDYILAPQSCYR